MMQHSQATWWIWRPWLACDQRALALFRIGICLHQIHEVWTHSPYFTAFYTSDGIWGETLESDWDFTLHQFLFYRGEWYFSTIMLFIHAMVTVCYLFGIHTHFNAIIFHVLTLSLQQRGWAGTRQNSAERWFRHMTFWAMFLPTQMWTVDESSRIRQLRGQSDQLSKDQSHSKRNLSKYDDSNEKNPNNIRDRAQKSQVLTLQSWSTIAIHFQMMIIYIAALVNRWPYSNWDWQECSAVYYSLGRYRMSHDFGKWMAGFPGLCQMLCRFTLVLEWLIPMLVWLIPMDMIRTMVLFFTYSMHFGFAISFQLGPYPFVSAVSLLPFLPPSLLDWLEQHTEQVWRPFLSLIHRISVLTDHHTPDWLNQVYHLCWVEENEEVLEEGNKHKRYLRPAWLNSTLAMLFAVYFMSNQMSQPPFDLWPRWDNGYIENVLCLSQKWNMFSKVSNTSVYDFVVADLDTDEGNLTVVYNDLHVTNYQQASVFDLHSFQRHANPTHAWKLSRWPRAVRMAEDMDYRMWTLMNYFCMEINDWARHGNGKLTITMDHVKNNQSRVDHRQVQVCSAINIKVCVVGGKIVDMAQAMRDGHWLKYEDEKVSCRAKFDCESGELNFA